MLCLLAAVAFGLDAWQKAAQRSGGHMWLESVICGTAAPAQSLVLKATLGARAAWASAMKARLLADENERLTTRVADLEEALSALQERYAGLRRERELRSAYAAVRRPEQMAHVIAVGSGGWLSFFTIDRGRAEGVRVRDVAVTKPGVVGQVCAVAEHSARILPITDIASGVAVRVRRSRETGVLKGLGAWQCELLYLGPQAQVRNGDELLTAGIGGVFPAGLRVGTITSVAADPNTSGKKAAVEPAARLQNVEEVLLLRAPRVEE
jgi:rod shape-determining protein MreC